MIELNLASLTITEKNKIYKINLFDSINDPNIFFEKLNSMERFEDVSKVFKNWLLLGFFKNQNEIINQCLNFLDDDKTLKIINASLIEFNPIWGSYGEVNFKFFSNYSSCSETLKEILESYGISAEVKYSLFYMLITIFNILSRFLINQIILL